MGNKNYLNSGCFRYSYFFRERNEVLKKKKGVNRAVSDIVGNILLLGVSVSLFIAIYIAVLSHSPSPSKPSVDLICTVEGDNVIIEHQGEKNIRLKYRNYISF